jgi:hypothetical protein
MYPTKHRTVRIVLILLLSVSLTACMGAAGAFTGSTSVYGASATVGDFTVTGDDGSYSFDEASGVLTVTGDVTVSTSSSTSQRIVVASDCTLTLDGVDITASGGPAIKINPDVNATLTLADDSSNSVTGGAGHAGIQVAWADEDNYAALTVDGSGSLNATGGSGSGGAGIGGSYADKGLYGDITIKSGDITSTGTNRSAGIGSSNNPTTYGYVDTKRGTITIDGGTVNAYGVNSGAGIGGGNHMSGGTIVINGGEIYAEGDSGIGSGLGSSKTSGNTEKGPGWIWADITINGGTVTAYATNNMGAGIGGGMYGDGIVTINDGTVTASVNTKGNLYQGGAGIGGGYQGCGLVKINGGNVTATGGNGCPGIGDGALAATTTTNKYSDGTWSGTKNVRTGLPHIAAGESGVTINGGTVTANGGYGAAGIGSGNSSEWCNVEITGGTVVANGYASDSDEKLGGAGIGSGTSAVPSKMAYMKQTTENISITGGTITATGGWGAAGIGSGANNDSADSITISDGADIKAFADGTKFAIDTKESGGGNVDTTGNFLQGTLVKSYEDSGIAQDTAGFTELKVINDEDENDTVELSKPAGYRSFATTVSEPGTYSVYTDDEEIGRGEGRFFSRMDDEDYDPEQAHSDGNTVQYTVTSDELSDNNFLFPVKSVVVNKSVIADDETMANVNGTVYFRLQEKNPDGSSGSWVDKSDGSMWLQSIEIVDGVPQTGAFFVNIPDKTFDVWEVDKNGEKIEASESNPVLFGTVYLVGIRTSHAGGDDNNAVIDDDHWSDTVEVQNTFVTDPEKEVVPDPADGPDSGSGEGGADSGSNHSVNTGDDSFIMLYSVLLIASALALSCLVLFSRLGHRER